MSVLRDDIRVAFRRFRHQPGFTAVAVMTLALGFGANTAIFGLVEALLLRSLPVERPEELYRIGDTNACCVNSGLMGSFSLFSTRLFEQLRDSAPEYSKLTAFQAGTLAGTATQRIGDSRIARQQVRDRELLRRVRCLPRRRPLAAARR